MPHWIDVSIRLRHGLIPWPGDAPFELNRVSDLARGDDCTFSTLSMSAHAGTHVDAPLHFVKRGRSVDTLPLEATVGPARVIVIRSSSAYRCVLLTAMGRRPARFSVGQKPAALLPDPLTSP